MKKTGLYRREITDYTKQGCVLYTPPFDWNEKSKLTMWRLSKLADISGRFLMSPPDSCGETSTRAKALRVRGYALDNGAFTYHKKGKPFNDKAFIRMIRRFGENADWIVIPDVLFNAKETIELSKKWIPIIQRITPATPMLFVWQDGMKMEHLAPFVSDNIGIFIGGSTEGKLKHLPQIADLCSSNRVWLHVGRVNTIKRIKICKSYGACSFDGSGYTRFVNQVELIHRYIMQQQRQLSLFQNNFCNVKIQEWIR